MTDNIYAEKVRERTRANWNKHKEKYNARRNYLHKNYNAYREKWLEAQHKTYYKHHEERKRKLRMRPPEKKYEDNQKQKNNGNVDIHRLYNSTDSRKHREMLLPIVEQLYPEIKMFMKGNEKES